jgi:hypothetical protein
LGECLPQLGGVVISSWLDNSSLPGFVDALPNDERCFAEDSDVRNTPRRLLRALEQLADEPELLYAILYEAHERDPFLFESTRAALHRAHRRYLTEAGGNVLLFMWDVSTHAQVLDQERHRNRPPVSRRARAGEPDKTSSAGSRLQTR